MRKRFTAAWAKIVTHYKSFDLFPDYWPTMAEHWNSIIWGTGPVFFLLFGVWLSLGTPPVKLMVIGFVWALVVAGYYAWRADHLKLVPRLGLREPCYHVHEATRHDRQIAQYVQISPICLTDAPIEGCTAHLLRIMRWDHLFERWAPTELDHAIPLLWSYSDASPHTLQPGIDYRVNVMWFIDRGQIDIETFPPVAATESVFSTGEFFRFDIRFTANNTPPLDLSIRVGLTTENEKGWYENLTVEKL